jgi:hypothetical protein
VRRGRHQIENNYEKTSQVRGILARLTDLSECFLKAHQGDKALNVVSVKDRRF